MSSEQRCVGGLPDMMWMLADFEWVCRELVGILRRKEDLIRIVTCLLGRLRGVVRVAREVRG
jgi:hypothetical protein